MPLLDQIDSAEAFVRPVRAFSTLATKQRAELSAMAGIEAVVGELLRAREGRHVGDFLNQIAEAWDDTTGEQRVLARDLITAFTTAVGRLLDADDLQPEFVPGRPGRAGSATAPADGRVGHHG